jgi:hypothetical protein
MGILYDILASSVIGGFLFLLMFNFNLFTSDVRTNSTTELNLQTNAKTLAEILNTDLRKMGFNYKDTAIVEAKDKKISFWADIDSNGVADKVSYYLGDSTEVSGTENPRDKILYREVNGVKKGGPSLGLVNMRFTYRNSTGVQTYSRGEIKYIEVEIWVQSSYKVKIPYTGKDDYLFTYWEMTINPRNI